MQTFCRKGSNLPHHWLHQTSEMKQESVCTTEQPPPPPPPPPPGPAVDHQWCQMRKFRTNVSKIKALANLLATINIYKSMIYKSSKLKHKRYVPNRMDTCATVYHRWAN